MKMWESLSHELNYNVMFSQRGVLNIGHSPAQMDAYARRGNAMRLNGIDAELFTQGTGGSRPARHRHEPLAPAFPSKAA